MANSLKFMIMEFLYDVRSIIIFILSNFDQAMRFISTTSFVIGVRPPPATMTFSISSLKKAAGCVMNNKTGAFRCRLPFNYIPASNFPNVVICICWKFRTLVIEAPRAAGQTLFDSSV